jgi:hypothetical protein
MVTATQARARGIVAGLKGESRLWRHRDATHPALLRAWRQGYDEAVRARAKDNVRLTLLRQRIVPVADGDPFARSGVKVLLPEQ